MSEKQGKGKPRIFKTEEDFEAKFIEYVNHCERRKELANIAGFCYYSGMTRVAFYDQKEHYPYTFNRIQECLEDRAINAHIGDSFKAFYLKNKFSYKDKVETENLNYEAKTYEEFLAKVTGDEY